MKALILDKDKQLSITETDVPNIGAHDVLVKIKASALNHREIWITKGLYPGMSLPCILGADGAGTVIKTGKGVDQKWLNEDIVVYPAYDWGENEEASSKQFRVLGMPDPGTIAEYIKLPVQNVVKKPPYLSWEESAAVPLAGLTAWRALVKHGKIKSGDNVLITGIGGGVAQAGLAIVKAFGANAFVSSSSEDKIAHAVKMGAKAGVNYKEENWNIALKEIAGSIDIVLDGSPTANLDDYLKFMRYGGKIIAYGSTGSLKTTLSISKFFLRHIHFIGTAMGSPRDFREMLEFFELKKIKPMIHQVFDFDKIIEAIEVLKSGQQTGKVVIRH